MLSGQNAATFINEMILATKPRHTRSCRSPVKQLGQGGRPGSAVATGPWEVWRRGVHSSREQHQTCSAPYGLLGTGDTGQTLKICRGKKGLALALK